MKIMMLNKEEQKALAALLAPLVTTAGCPYELTTILEKLDWRMYECVFKHPELFKFSRKQRVANGSGKTMQDINKVLKKYEQMKEMMKKMEQYRKTGKMPPGGLGGMGGMGGMGFPGM